MCWTALPIQRSKKSLEGSERQAYPHGLAALPLAYPTSGWLDAMDIYFKAQDRLRRGHHVRSPKLAAYFSANCTRRSSCLPKVALCHQCEVHCKHEARGATSSTLVRTGQPCLQHVTLTRTCVESFGIGFCPSHETWCVEAPCQSDSL